MDQILQTLPQEKLIIDIRGNPGGIIPSGERLVQLLTKNQITPSPVAFRNTPSTKGFGGIQDFSRWKRSLDLMEETGAIFSQYYPLSTFDNLPVYRYPGKAALIIDSLVYSTADFVTADFKDNNIGPIIGVDPRTGAGGANVWPYETLVYYAQKVGNMDVGLLPKGIGLNVAMRRSIRTGIDQGLPVEDLGTKADIVHAITANDLLYDNVDLINFTASKLV
jgi:C-terminal processing protease CtpA/Prc